MFQGVTVPWSHSFDTRCHELYRISRPHNVAQYVFSLSSSSKILNVDVVFLNGVEGFRVWGLGLQLMIEILHCLKDPKLWELWYIIMGSAGFIPSTVIPPSTHGPPQGTLRQNNLRGVY